MKIFLWVYVLAKITWSAKTCYLYPDIFFSTYTLRKIIPTDMVK
jgi:hypothetical protein